MVKVKVSFYGVIKDAVKEPQVEVQMSDAFTMRQLLESLREKYGDKFKSSIFDEKYGVKTYVRFFVNKEPLDNFELDKELRINGENAETAILVMPSSEGG